MTRDQLHALAGMALLIVVTAFAGVLDVDLWDEGDGR